ncbi:orf61 [Artaxa digramma nucleopolyhedrovirus]|uniref:Orf61 n=1 Tax=Artaxa digramma nucleopolyhedrovirus TaxID=3070910 RepID=A0AAE6R6A2_9ABAC|nr:orf61 [Euproctis digramma nucleopolyhedrovirus]QHB21720.1 orf61 [Artaxa digramma nucleopolyhedrovirus]
MSVDSLQTWCGRMAVRCAVPAIDLYAPHFASALTHRRKDDLTWMKNIFVNTELSWLSNRPKLKIFLKTCKRILPASIFCFLVTNCIPMEMARVLKNEEIRLKMIQDYPLKFYVFEFMNNFCDDTNVFRFFRSLCKNTFVDETVFNHIFAQKHQNRHDSRVERKRRNLIIMVVLKLLNIVENYVMSSVNKDVRLVQTYVSLSEKIKMYNILCNQSDDDDDKCSFFSCNFKIFAPTEFFNEMVFQQFVEEKLFKLCIKNVTRVKIITTLQRI